MFWVQVAHTAAPTGLQSQVWPPKPPPLLQTAPAGQFADVLQAWVQTWLVVSQFWLTQSALLLHVPQVLAGQSQSPVVQVAPLQSADVVQVVLHCEVARLHWPLAQSVFCAQVPQAAIPVLVQPQTEDPPSVTASQVWPPHWLDETHRPEQVPLAASQVPLAQSPSTAQVPQLAMVPARLQSQTPAPPSGAFRQLYVPVPQSVELAQGAVHFPF